MESWLDKKSAELWTELTAQNEDVSIPLAARLASSSTVAMMVEELKELEPLQKEAQLGEQIERYHGAGKSKIEKEDVAALLSKIALEISLTAIFREMNKLALFKRIDGGGKKGNVTLKGLSEGIPKSKLLKTLSPFVEELGPFKDPSVYEKELKEADGLEEADGCVSQSEFVKVWSTGQREIELLPSSDPNCSHPRPNLQRRSKITKALCCVPAKGSRGKITGQSAEKGVERWIHEVRAAPVPR